MAPYSGAMLPIVARSASFIFETPGPKNSTNLLTTPCLRRICVTVSTRSVAVAPAGNWPVISKPTTSGISIYSGWPSITASASMPPTPQPTTPNPLIIVVWLSVPTSESGSATGPLCVGAQEDPLGQIFEIDLMANADGRRDDAEVIERLLAPAQEFIALAVSLELQFDVLVERAGGGEVIDLHRMVDHQIDRDQRIDPPRVAPQSLHGRPHRGQIDHQRNAGKVLQQHSGGFEGDFDRLRSCSGCQPARCLTCSSVTSNPSQLRRADSSSTRIENGSSAIRVRPSSSSLRQPVECGFAGTRFKHLASTERIGFSSRTAHCPGPSTQAGKRPLASARGVAKP